MTAGSLAASDCALLRAVSTEEALPPLMAEAIEDVDDMADANLPSGLVGAGLT